jgi:phosphatidate cytidylyltransferase
MKQRIITSLVGLVILGVVLAFYETIVLDLVVAVLIVMALYELLHACGSIKNRIYCGFLMATGILIPLFPAGVLARHAALLLLLFALALLTILLVCHRTLVPERAGFTAFYALMIALAFGCIVWMRDNFGMKIGFYALIVTLVGAWMSDTGAYFAGVFFGKHKLCPEISPKKTIEGVVGGIVGAMLGQAIAAILFAKIVHAEIPWIFVALSPLFTVVSIIGDLSASLVKREFGIKDFSNLMPGHGGILDRFDSVLPLLPLVYLIFAYLNPIVLL